jgi:hypothetical protein
MSVDLTPHFMSLQGQKYLKVSGRVLLFRDQHPGGAITTELVQLDLQAGFALYRATVIDNEGKLLGTAYGSETQKGFPPGWVEKAETVAVGRALAVAGFGTAFAVADFYESADSKLADAPQAAPARPTKPADVQKEIGNQKVTKEDTITLWNKIREAGYDADWLKVFLQTNGMPGATADLTMNDVAKIELALIAERKAKKENK